MSNLSEIINNLSELADELPTERCWRTGQYNEDATCDFCDHRYECGGYEGDDADDDD